MNKILALVITYNPNNSLENILSPLLTQFDKIILVDNGSEAVTQNSIKKQARLLAPKISVILNAQNLGIAAALNRGFSLAIQLGYDYVMTLDQDSVPMQGMLKAMSNAYNQNSGRNKIAIVAPLVEDPISGISTRYLRSKNHWFFERKKCTGQVLENISLVITSGSIYSLKIYKQVGPFRDDFFIDYVDTEYCLRVRQQRYNILVVCNARLHHKLGDQKKIRLGPLEMHPTFHSKLRWYYISRNRIPMIRTYGLSFPHWLLYEFVIDSYGLLRMLLFEDHKMGKMLAAILGCVDGLFGRSGEIPTSRKTLLSKLD